MGRRSRGRWCRHGRGRGRGRAGQLPNEWGWRIPGMQTGGPLRSLPVVGISMQPLILELMAEVAQPPPPLQLNGIKQTNISRVGAMCGTSVLCATHFRSHPTSPYRNHLTDAEGVSHHRRSTKAADWRRPQRHRQRREAPRLQSYQLDPSPITDITCIRTPPRDHPQILRTQPLPGKKALSAGKNDRDRGCDSSSGHGAKFVVKN